MEEVLLQENWKKECRTWVAISVFVCVIGVAASLRFYFQPVSDDPIKDCVTTAICFGVLLCVVLYAILYCAFYKLTVTEEKLIRKSLFGTKEIAIREIDNYDFKKYSKISELYEFRLWVHNKTVKIYTHYPERLKEILDSNKLV